MNKNNYKYIKYKQKYKNKCKNDVISRGGNINPVDNSLVLLNTTSFHIKKSKGNKSETNNIFDIYYTTKHEHEHTIQKNIATEIYNKAIASVKGGNLDNLYNPYNTRHYCNYMAEKIYGGTTCKKIENKIICQEWGIIWSQDVSFEVNDILTIAKIYLNAPTAGIERKQIDLNKYICNLTKNNASSKWIIIPVGVCNHSVSVIIYRDIVQLPNHFNMYICDPNGQEYNDPTNLGRCIKSLICHLKNICEQNNNLSYKGHLLKDIAPQGGTALMYISSKGFCAAFTWMIIFLIIINHNIYPSKLYKYIQYRQQQWNNSKQNNTDTIDYDMLVKLVNMTKEKEFAKDKIDIKMDFGNNIIFSLGEMNVAKMSFIKINDNITIENDGQILNIKTEEENTEWRTPPNSNWFKVIWNLLQPTPEQKSALATIDTNNSNNTKAFNDYKRLNQLVNTYSALKETEITIPLNTQNVTFSLKEMSIQEMSFIKIRENITIKNDGRTLKIDTIIMNSSSWFKDIFLNKKLNLTPEQIATFRQETIDENNLNWFETHILMYLLYVREFFIEKFPIVIMEHNTEFDTEESVSINTNCSDSLSTNDQVANKQ